MRKPNLNPRDTRLWTYSTYGEHSWLMIKIVDRVHASLSLQCAQNEDRRGFYVLSDTKPTYNPLEA